MGDYTGLHSEMMHFLLIDTPNDAIILGCPWLQIHKPQFSCGKGELLIWGATCAKNILVLTLNCRPPVPEIKPTSAASLSAVSPIPLVLSKLLPKYHNLGEVFAR